MPVQTIEEGLALYSLRSLSADQIPDVVSLFLAVGCDVPEMAALAGSLTLDHPADRRSDFERAVRLAGRAIPSRIDAAHILKGLYARRAASGALPPRAAASLIKDTFQLVEAELPKAGPYVGDSFGISTLIGLYYSYDDIAHDDAASALELDRDLLEELIRIAKEGD
jgi:hypothetical protein